MSTTTTGQDTLQKFIFDNAAVRGELIDISATWREVLARHHYPAPVKNCWADGGCGRPAVGQPEIQRLHHHADPRRRPGRLLVVECDADLRLRATAKLAPDAGGRRRHADLAAERARQGPLRHHARSAGKSAGPAALPGHRAAGRRRRGTVIENYMLRSEQLDTKLWLAADDTVSRGLLLQKLPHHGGKAEATPLSEDEALETWNRAVILGSTLKEEELLSTGIDVLIQRLFWEETIRVFDPLHPQFHCSCTREKVGNMLKMLGREEVEA
jgi:molecular chaperone Hsp33